MHKREYWKNFASQPTIILLEGDITKQETDVIVNATTKDFELTGGVDKAITQAAGPLVKEECHKYGVIQTSQVIITPGYELAAKYIIHTVGPVYGKENGQETELLTACYRNCLWLADRYAVTSISFPAISTGIFGYPFAEAVRIMARSIGSYFFDPANLQSCIREVYCVFYTEEKFLAAEKEFEAIFNRKEIG